VKKNSVAGGEEEGKTNARNTVAKGMNGENDAGKSLQKLTDPSGTAMRRGGRLRSPHYSKRENSWWWKSCKGMKNRSGKRDAVCVEKWGEGVGRGKIVKREKRKKKPKRGIKDFRQR